MGVRQSQAMGSVRGSHAVVTGAGSGIGRGIALALAADGADVVVADVDAEAAERVAGEIRALGQLAIAVRTDVSRLTEVQALADVAYETLGSVEILVNNAGVALRPFRSSWDTSYEDFSWVIGVNLWGVLHGHQAFVPRMLETTGSRHIVNTSSMSNVIDAVGASAYAAAKGAVTSFSIAAAAELAPVGIGLTILLPGHVTTALATSERLRPESERSATRGVKPYRTPFSTYLNAGDGDRDVPGAPPPPSDVAMFAPLDPMDAGRMTVRAILDNQLFCFTHVPPADDMRARTEQMISSYQPL
jgi:NAD(P)-dependent dehydrogenase (short-subunit alcohol dehydrogenase family)